MTENLDSNGGGAEKRRSTRVMHSASITVKGTDALGHDFRESTKTVMVNCYGCQYQGIRYPAPNSSIMLEVRHENRRRTPRVVPARVIWVRRPQAYRSFYQVGIEFEVPGNVWDIALPPADWFPSPEDEDLVIPVSGEAAVEHPNQFVLRASAEVESAGSGGSEAAALITASRATGTLLLPEEQPMGAARADSGLSPSDRSASIVEMVRMFTAEAVAGEIARIRELIDAELQCAIDKAVDRLSERIAAAPALRRAVADSSASAEQPSDDAAQAAQQGATPGHSNARESESDSPESIQTNARQRRAAKRAQKRQKITA